MFRKTFSDRKYIEEHPIRKRKKNVQGSFIIFLMISNLGIAGFMW